MFMYIQFTSQSVKHVITVNVTTLKINCQAIPFIALLPLFIAIGQHNLTLICVALRLNLMQREKGF